MKRTVTIAHIPGWIDRADVNWQAHGGSWFHPPVAPGRDDWDNPTEGQPLWAAIRLDTPDDEGGLTHAVAVLVDPTSVQTSDLDTCDVPHEYDPEEYPDRATYDMARVDAYIATWGMNGRQGGEEYSDRDPAKARAAAAHFLLGKL